MPKLFKSRTKHKPRLPEGLRFYVVADIHGAENALVDVLTRIDADQAAHPSKRSVQIFLGDYVDRGPATRQVLERLIARARSHEILMLKGNHEELFLSFFKDPAVLSSWRQYGGLQTLTSYGLQPSFSPTEEEQLKLSAQFERAVPAEHRLLLEGLPSSFSCGDYYFVHAGVRPGIPLKNQKDEDLLWIRQDFLLHEGMFEKFIVHGHTPVKEPEVHKNRINLDTGAYATGRLTCLVLDDDKQEFI